VAYAHYERLSALDASFLELEDANAHMHDGSVALFELGPLACDDGGLDFERILRATEAVLRRSVRLRQRLAAVPVLGHPVWVDDERFNLLYHVRHASLPAPGDVRSLKRLAGRVMSQQLDRGKPLWELWFVEGVEGGRFAVITKLHHCLADGVSGAELFATLMGADATAGAAETRPWIPRPAPSSARLLGEELARRALRPLSLLRSAGRCPAAAVRGQAAGGSGWRGLRETFSAGLSRASETPFNADLGPHRRFDWTCFELEAVEEVTRRCDGKLDDVVLAVVAGAVRRFLRGRGLRVSDLDFRAMVPVNVRADAERDALGHRVSQMLARLPVDEPDPRRRLERVLATTRELKASAQRAGGEALAQLSEWLGPLAIAWLARLALEIRAANLVVTNVPGPPRTIHLLGAPMTEVYPVVPLAARQTLGIALFSYAGGLHWGLNADWDALPDLHDLARALDVEFEALRKATGALRVEAAGG
jgi:diacylglycerol O-acyltransferase